MNIVLFSEEEILAGRDSAGKCSVRLPVKDERTQHILKVLHKVAGDSFDAGLVDGMAGKAVLSRVEKGNGQEGAESENGLYFDFEPESDGKPLYPVELIVGFPRPIQLKRLFRDVAGLGVSAVHLCGTELGEKSYMDSGIVEKGAAYTALLEGTAQAKSTHVPELKLYQSVAACLESLSGNCGEAVRVMLDNVKPEGPLFGYLEKSGVDSCTRPVIAAIGSERGWTDNERNLFERNGFAACSMGSRVLRTETAATVAATIILQKMGIL